jgi:hypothetical protein
MRVVLSTLTFDLAGSIALTVQQEQIYGETRRRMNRIATLDGGAVFNDFGFSEADRTLTLRWPVKSAAQEAAVERLAQLYGRVHVATPKGFFLAAVEAYTPGAAESALSLLVITKLA